MNFNFFQFTLVQSTPVVEQQPQIVQTSLVQNGHILQTAIPAQATIAQVIQSGCQVPHASCSETQSAMNSTILTSQPQPQAIQQQILPVVARTTGVCTVRQHNQFIVTTDSSQNQINQQVG